MLRREFTALMQVLLNAPREETAFTVDVDLVNVLCTVRDKNGRYVQDLNREDFEVRDEGAAQEIRHFSREKDAPLTIAMLIDVSGSVASAVSAEREAAQRFFTEVMNPADRGMVVGFWSAVTVWQDLTSSPDIIGEAIEREVHAMPAVPASYEAQLRGGTLLYDAVKLVTTQKLMKRSGRKVLVLITDGVDQGSYAKSGSAARAAQEADAVVYGIHFNGNAYLPTEGMGPLRKLCEPTGGRVFKANKDAPLGQVFAMLRDEVRGQYALAYRRPDRAGQREFRKIEVKIKRPGLKAFARSGYYTRPETQ